MVIRNMTTRAVLADHAQVASTPLQRIIGLLNRQRLATGEGMIFPQCQSIHTCGMRFSLDVVFLKHRVVVKVVQALAPWRMVWALGADTVIELPVGTIARTSTQPGGQVEWTTP